MVRRTTRTRGVNPTQQGAGGAPTAAAADGPDHARPPLTKTHKAGADSPRGIATNLTLCSAQNLRPSAGHTETIRCSSGQKTQAPAPRQERNSLSQRVLWQFAKERGGGRCVYVCVYTRMYNLSSRAVSENQDEFQHGKNPVPSSGTREHDRHESTPW